MPKNPKELRETIRDLVEEYHDIVFRSRPFVPGVTPVPVAGRVFDATDIQMLVDSGLDFWLTTGRFAATFKREFSKFMGVRHALLTNSGSSANFLALSALTSKTLVEKCLKPGDEIIT
ncbi:MAG: DegT/DnrJ/EryC1/StrS family aminotransferase, partial [Patescibacteria group bacterium]